MESATETVTTVDLASILRKGWWKVLLAAFLAGAVAYGMALRVPNRYQSTAVISPAGDDQKKFGAASALASMGLSIGGPTRIEDIESVFRSGDLAVRVFADNSFWGVIYPDRYDPASGTFRSTEGLLGGDGNERKPTEWTAIRVGKSMLKVVPNRKAGTLQLSFEAPSPKGAHAILTRYIEEAKSRLQEEALDKAQKNKKFIEGQIDRANDPLTRDRLFQLFGQEVEREMLARNRDQFGFRVIDSPRVPDRKSGPSRLKYALSAAIFTTLLVAGILLLRGSRMEPGK